MSLSRVRWTKSGRSSTPWPPLGTFPNPAPRDNSLRRLSMPLLRWSHGRARGNQIFVVRSRRGLVWTPPCSTLSFIAFSKAGIFPARSLVSLGHWRHCRFQMDRLAIDVVTHPHKVPHADDLHLTALAPAMARREIRVVRGLARLEILHVNVVRRGVAALAGQLRQQRHPSARAGAGNPPPRLKCAASRRRCSDA